MVRMESNISVGAMVMVHTPGKGENYHYAESELTTFFDYPREIRRLIYTTNLVEGYHRQLRKVTKTKTKSRIVDCVTTPAYNRFHQIPPTKKLQSKTATKNLKKLSLAI